MTPEQLTKTLKELDSKGASKQEIEAVYNAYKNKTATAPVQDEQGTGGIKGVGVGLLKSGASAVRGMGVIGQEIAQQTAGRAVEAITGTPKEDLGTDIYDPESKKGAEITELLRRKGGAEKFGGFVGDVAQFAIPGGQVVKATKGLGLAYKILARGVTSGIIGATQGGGAGRDIVKEGLIAGGIDAAIPGATKVLSPVATYGKNVLKSLAGSISGAGGDVIERAFANPDDALKGIREGDTVLKEVATSVRQGVKNLKQKASQEYEALTSQVTKILDKNNLLVKINSVLVDEADATFKDGKMFFKDTPLLETEEKQLSKMYNVIQNWTDWSAKGANQLATKVSRFRRGGTESANMDRIVDSVRRNIRNFVGDEVPTIKEAILKFSDKMDLIDELDSILKVRGSVDSRQGIRETSQRIARLFNANKDLSREAVEELEREMGIDVLATEAGRQLSGNATKFQIGAGDTGVQIIRSLIPKEVIGNVVARTGQAKQLAEKMLGEKLQRLDATTRGVVIELFTDLFGTEQTQEDQKQDKIK